MLDYIQIKFWITRSNFIKINPSLFKIINKMKLVVFYHVSHYLKAGTLSACLKTWKTKLNFYKKANWVETLIFLEILFYRRRTLISVKYTRSKDKFGMFLTKFTLIWNCIKHNAIKYFGVSFGLGVSCERMAEGGLFQRHLLHVVTMVGKQFERNRQGSSICLLFPCIPLNS